MDEKYKKFLEGLKAVGSDPAAVMQYLYANPDYAALLKEQQAKKLKGEKVADDISTSLDILKNVGFTAAALDQIAVSNKNAPTKPSMPSVPGRDPLLAQALYEARRGVADPSAVLAPAKQEIQDAYQNNLVQAKSASGGQAGSFQAMTQAANTARMRAALGLAPIAQQAQLSNQGVYNDLLGQRLGETQRMFENQLGVAGTNLEQYNLESQIAGLAGAYGRENLYKSLGNISDTMSQNPYYLPFDDGIKNYMNKVRSDNSMNTQGGVPSSNFADPYSNYGGSYRPFTSPVLNNRIRSSQSESYA